MKVLLVGPDYEENLSIRYLSSSLLHAGHNTTLAAFNSVVDVAPVAQAAQDADLVGLSMCFQSRAREFLHLARAIKSRNSKKVIVAGGHYASCAAEPLLANHAEIDIVVIHEGEKTLVEIANAVPQIECQLSRIAGIAYRQGKRVCFTHRRPTLADLDVLPLPDRRGHIHSIAGVPTSYLMGSRGCYGSCAYCCISTLHRMAPGKRFRQRHVERIADEMSLLYHERGTRQFVFHDDNFLVPSETLNQARMAAFERALKKRGLENIALVIKGRPADASQDVLRRLKDLGLVRIFLGVESSTQRGLSALEREQSVEESERALQICAELDISAQFTLMVFNPDTTLETLRSDVSFMRRFCANPLNFCRAEIYAGTPLERRMVEFGRAKGDYLARVYEMADPVADRACKIALNLFDARCWRTGSLMQHAIGLDHTAAVVKRFAPAGEAVLCRRTSDWVRTVNLDTINFLEQVVDLAASVAGKKDPHLGHMLSTLQEREARSRRDLLAAGFSLRAELDSLDPLGRVNQVNPTSTTRLRMTRQIAAGLLAMGIPAALAFQAAAQEVKSPPSVSSADQENSGSLTGKVTDPSGAVISNADIVISRTDTGAIRSLKTDREGQYVVDGLAPGRYSVEVIAPGFAFAHKTDIRLKAGNHERADFVLQVAETAVCEYAAAPLQPEENLIEKKKPFTYYVGQEKDGHSFPGIAKLVYGDPRAWVQLFEANRNSVSKPGFLPEGTPIFIPKRQRIVPKLIYKVMPAYPTEARKERISGDVVMDVSLKSDGAVDAVNVIDGNPLLADAAVNAVKKWRYRPRLRDGKPIDKFVVAISFDKRGRVR